MKAALKVFAEFVLGLAEAVLILFAFVVLLKFVSAFFPEVSGVTPPGAAGISIPWMLLVSLASLLFFVCAWLFSSAAPCIGAAFWIAWVCGEIAFVDGRTELRMAYYDLSTWQVYEPVFASGAVVLVVLLAATGAGRMIRVKRLRLLDARAA